MKTKTFRYVSIGLAHKIANQRGELPVGPLGALAKIFIQPKRDWSIT